MADTQVKLTSPPYSNTEECKKHIMKIYENLTKDCKDELLREIFDQAVDYDALNACAIRMFICVADKGLLDEAKDLFKPHPEQTTLPEVAVFTIVMVGMMAISSTESIKEAHKVFQQMIASGVTPTTYTYTVLIDGFTKDFSDSNFFGYAKKYFLEMLDRRMKPQDQLYLKVLGAVTYQEPAEEVKKFLDQVKAKGFIPAVDFLQYKKDRGTTEALQVLKTYMNIGSKITDKAVQEFFCQSVKYSCFMPAIEMQMALVDDGNVDEAIELSDTVQQTKFMPLVQVYTYLIEAYLKFGKTKGALDAYLEMLAAGVAPNSYTYAVLIKGLSADPEFLGDAKKYLLEMMDRGKQPNAATYTAVIEGFARKEDKAAEDEGKEFVEVMMGKGFVPNAKAMREALKGSPIPVIRRIMNIVLSKLKD